MEKIAVKIISVSLNISSKAHTNDLLTWLIFYTYSLESTMHHHAILIPGRQHVSCTLMYPSLISQHFFHMFLCCLRNKEAISQRMFSIYFLVGKQEGTCSSWQVLRYIKYSEQGLVHSFALLTISYYLWY